MKSVKDFFEEVEEFRKELDSRNQDTIHTDKYQDTVRDLYADWHEVKISLKPLIEQQVIESIDNEFSDLIVESRRTNSRVSESASCLRLVEDRYVQHVYPAITNRSVETGFVNSLVTDLEAIETDKYHEYMEEAIQCVQAGAYRGAVVLGWQAAIFALYQELDDHEDPIHVAYQKKFKTKPDFKIDSFWDFQKIPDSNILILAESIGIIDKSLKDMLDREIDIRHKAAHPGAYDVGPNATKALLETVMQLLTELHL